MPTILASVRRLLAVVTALVLTGAVAATTAEGSASAGDRGTARARSAAVKVHRGGPDRTVTFHRGRKGEAFLHVTVSARGVSWAQRKNESAVVSAYVDGHYATDIVIMSSSPTKREFALGMLGQGRHRLRLHYAAARSRSRAGVATLAHLRVRTVRRSSPAYAAARYAPVLYGRALEALGGRFQNSRTDTPLVAWHQTVPAAKPGHSVIEYSVIWSNEDGGTNPPALMAQWGRTTDIEWVYRVEVNARGRRVADTGYFQSPNHGTQLFRGSYDGTHPVLQTCTANNNVCDRKALRAQHQKRDPMRFALSTRRVLPADQPREHEMDVQPWSYQVMAREMVREKQIESPSDPDSLNLGDQRTYLYVAVDHTADPPASAGNVGLAVDVQLSDDTTYTSNHGVNGWTILRNGPAATTVELPAGTTRADVANIVLRRVVLTAPDDATLTVTALDRAFFLRHNYLPKASFASWHGSATLTSADPTVGVWAPS
jgi:hypothetical protein